MPFEKRTANAEVDSARWAWRKMEKLVGSCEIFPRPGLNVAKVITAVISNADVSELWHK